MGTTGKITRTSTKCIIPNAVTCTNAVGYTNYPDNLIREFIQQSAASGVDVFRIFDSLNWIKGMEVAIDGRVIQVKLRKLRFAIRVIY